MSSVHQARRDGVAGEAPSRVQRIEKRLQRYPAKHAATVRALAAQHFALADLALSFPALLFALAVPRDPIAARRGVEAVRTGRSLRDAADEAGVPMWLRGLPPEAFVGPLGEWPDGALFARHIANHLPRSTKRAADWLKTVEETARWGDEHIAVWAAREFERGPKAVDQTKLRLVCLWAWMSTHPEASASALCHRRWSPHWTFAKAAAEAGDWITDVEVFCLLGDIGLEDGWLTPMSLSGFVFEPLLTAEQISEQARAMRNCVRSYAWRLRRREARLWRVRRGDEIVATVEVAAAWRKGGGGIIGLRQALSRQNRETPLEVERAIHEWLRAQPILEAPPTADERRAADRSVWIACWRPYWREKRRLPAWLPLSPSLRALDNLRRGK